MHILVDSTGLQVYGAGQWLGEKHGARSRRGWRKLHVALDADSSEITAHTMTDQDAGDASQVEPLLNQIDGRIGQFTADGAYDGKPTYDAVTDHSAATVIVIPPRANAIEPAGGCMRRRSVRRRSRPPPLAETLRRSAASYDGISVILDWYCDRHVRSWKETYRVS